MVTTDRTKDGKDAALIPHEMDNQPLAPTQATIWSEVPTEFASIYGGRTHRILGAINVDKCTDVREPFWEVIWCRD